MIREPTAPEAFFGAGGALARALPGHEVRRGQIAMARAVAATLDAGGTLMVEAGTGTGKTLAYLVPAILSGRPVIVSTGTRNLQDQVFLRDLPLLRERLGLDFRAVRVKGRDNYLCRARFREFEQEPLFEDVGEAEFVDAVSRFARETSTGDRAEIPGLPDQVRFWRDVNARADACSGSRCADFEECWLTRLRREAQAASIVVVNHHLFFADLAVRSRHGAVLPEYDAVIFDEAHLIEDVATRFLGASVSSGQVFELAEDARRLAGRDGRDVGHADLRVAAEGFFSRARLAASLDGTAVRFLPPDRGGPDLEVEWATLHEALDRLASRAGGDDGAGDGLARRAEDLVDRLATVLDRSDPSYVYTVEARGAGLGMSAAPIDVSELLRDRLFSTLDACVLTSATLTVEKRFDFCRERLGLEHATELAVDSPFDFERQAVLYLPRDMPEPRAPDREARVSEEIERLLDVTDGRAFLLFTSYAAMGVARNVLAEGGRYPLFVQGEGSRAHLVEAFRATERAVLLGTSSFWHGVDVPGEALSLVVIDKLPFDSPGDPLVSARIDRLREEGGRPFQDYQVPVAVLELKQGLGRLIRGRSDHGILAVLDPRLTARGYGRTFLASLPDYPVVRDIDACRAAFDRFRGERAT